MRYSLNQGSADSVPVSPLLFPATRCVFATFRSFRPAPLRKSRRFMLLRALELSCRSFCNSDPLLPITSLQLQRFHAVAHSFAQRRAAIPPIFNSFHTLSIATGVVPL